MASWTTPPTHSSGDTLSVTDWNAIANNETFLYEHPYGAAYDSAGTSLTSSSGTQIDLGSTAFSGYSMSISSNSWQVPIAGMYFATAGATLNYTSTAGIMQALIYQNGSAIAAGNTVPNNASEAASTATSLIKCAASDLIALYGYQTSGSSESTVAGASKTYLHVFYIGST